MSQKNLIKRKDIISDDALNWGKEYSKAIKKAIKQNKKFEKSLNKINKKLRKSDVSIREKELKNELKIAIVKMISEGHFCLFLDKDYSESETYISMFEHIYKKLSEL